MAACTFLTLLASGILNIIWNADSSKGGPLMRVLSIIGHLADVATLISAGATAAGRRVAVANLST